jgi:hypothetical protein
MGGGRWTYDSLVREAGSFLTIYRVSLFLGEPHLETWRRLQEGQLESVRGTNAIQLEVALYPGRCRMPLHQAQETALVRPGESTRLARKIRAHRAPGKETNPEAQEKTSGGRAMNAYLDTGPPRRGASRITSPGKRKNCNANEQAGSRTIRLVAGIKQLDRVCRPLVAVRRALPLNVWLELRRDCVQPRKEATCQL